MIKRKTAGRGAPAVRICGLSDHALQKAAFDGIPIFPEARKMFFGEKDKPVFIFTRLLS
jgi:hypothetical protein